MPRFGKDKNARNEDLDRQAAEEVERLTRRGMGPGGGGMPGMGGGAPRIGPPSPLEMMAAEVADRPPPSRRQAQPARRPAPRPQQAFTAMPSGGVGSSFGPGGLNPGPRGASSAPPPPAFGGGAYDDDYGGSVTGPPVYNAGEPDEEEEMSITEMALMDHAARTGHNPEDLVMMYDAGTAEEMRDAAMRQFYERQQSRRPGARTNNPFAPAGQRSGPTGPAPARRVEDPKAAGGALAQRLAARRRREEEEARGAEPAPTPTGRTTRPTVPSAAAAAAAPAERRVDDGALSRVLARRRAALGVDSPTEQPAASGPRHPAGRTQPAPTLRSVPEPDDGDAPGLEDTTAAMPAKKAPAKRATKKAAAAVTEAPAAKAPAKRATKKAAAAEARAMPPAEEPPAAKAPAKRATKKAAAAVTEAPAAKAPAKRATKKAAAVEAPAKPPVAKARKTGATLAAPATKAPAKKAAARPAGKAKTVFCIECGEKNPAIAKFCFNCGTRLAAPEG